MPIARTNQPNPVFNLSPGTLLPMIPPAKMPAIARDEIVNNKRQSMVLCPMSPVKPIKEFRAIMSKDVPMASFIGSLISRTSDGISKKPPPAPNRPVTSPIPNPFNKSLIKGIFSSATTSVLLFGLFTIMETAAPSINTANRIMIDKDFEIV